MIMYHSWGSQNAWLRQILGRNVLYMHVAPRAALGLADGDWAWVVTHNGRIKLQHPHDGRRQPGHGLDLERHRQARRRLEAGGRCARGAEGFLAQPSHRRAPARGGEQALANADPVTGQAAWFDQRVRLEPCGPGEAGPVEPQFASLDALRRVVV